MLMGPPPSLDRHEAGRTPARVESMLESGSMTARYRTNHVAVVKDTERLSERI